MGNADNIKIDGSTTTVDTRGFVIVQGVLYDYNGSDAEVVIPQGVKVIWSKAFQGRRALTSIVIPEGVTTVGDEAFSGCSNLREVKLPESVTAIGEKAFSGCSNLRQIKLPESVTTIGDKAFFGCEKIAELTLPAGVGAAISKFCPKDSKMMIRIQDVSVLPGKYKPYAAICYAEDGGSNTDPRFEGHTKYMKANVAKLMDYAMEYPSLLALMCREKLIAPKNLDAYLSAAQASGSPELITMILDYQQNKVSEKEKVSAARQKEKQENMVFDRAVSRLEKDGIDGLNFVVSGKLYTFEHRNALKDFLESHGARLMSSMSAKTDFLIMNDGQAAGDKKKRADELGVEVITEYQFNDKAGRAFLIENGTLKEYIGSGGDITVPDGVITINSEVFMRCKKLTGIVIPKGVTSIGESMFIGCENLKNVVIPPSVTSIWENAFAECSSLESIVIPDGVTSIGAGAFSRCESLASVIIPPSVAIIAGNAFSHCKKLADSRGFVIVGNILFDYFGSDNHADIPAGVTCIGDRAFSHRESLAGVTIPSSVTNIAENAFYACKGLANEKGFVLAGGTLFGYYGSSEDVAIPEGISRVGAHAFACGNLTTAAIPEGVTRIGEYAFQYCSKLTSVKIPKSVTSIAFGAFDGCRNLVIHTQAGSYAESYAIKRRIPFVAE